MDGSYTGVSMPSRAKRTAAVAAAAKLSGADPCYPSDDDNFEAYFDHDDGGVKFPCRVKASGEGDGFYTAIFLKQDPDTKRWYPDGDETPGVHFDPKKGAGHGIWPRLDQSVEDKSKESRKSTTTKAAKDNTPKIHDDFDTLKAAGKLPTVGTVRNAWKKRNLPAGGSHRQMLERLHNYGA